MGDCSFSEGARVGKSTTNKLTTIKTGI